MAVEIRPEPEEAEREAIVAALDEAGAPWPYRSAWRAAGREELADGDSGD